MKTKTIYIIIGAWLVFLLAMALTGCRTKSVTEYVAVHDTLRVTATDTVRLVTTDIRTDTLRVETERIITVTKEGDTLKVVEWRDRWRDRVVMKTDTVIKHSTDTIYKVQQAEREKETVIKKPSWLTRIAVIAVILALAVLVVWGIKKK